MNCFTCSSFLLLFFSSPLRKGKLSSALFERSPRPAKSSLERAAAQIIWAVHCYPPMFWRAAAVEKVATC